ncbi:MAG TPA: ATP-dependent DNA ligase, partial [Streptosporangiaceae bacterium]|nr:ATP-dependent DNA ligase [Streptosporangiaceae bacterium]
MPGTSSELDDIHPDQFTIASMPARLDAIGDPWRGMDAGPQSLEPLLVMSARDAEAGLLDAPWPPVYPKQPGEP